MATISILWVPLPRNFESDIRRNDVARMQPMQPTARPHIKAMWALCTIRVLGMIYVGSEKVNAGKDGLSNLGNKTLPQALDHLVRIKCGFRNGKDLRKCWVGLIELEFESNKFDKPWWIIVHRHQDTWTSCADQRWPWLWLLAEPLQSLSSKGQSPKVLVLCECGWIL